MEKNKYRWNWKIKVLSIFAFCGLHIHCCPDPDIICLSTQPASLTTVSATYRSLVEDEQVVFDEIYLKNSFDIERSKCRRGGSALFRSPDCDPDYKDYESDLISLEIIPSADYNCEFKANANIIELFEMLIVDKNCSDYSKSIEDCLIRNVDSSDLFVEMINQYLGYMGQEPTLEYEFVFSIKEPPEQVVHTTFTFIWSMTENQTASNSSMSVQILP